MNTDDLIIAKGKAASERLAAEGFGSNGFDPYGDVPPPEEPPDDGGEHDDGEPTTWEPIDLGPWLRGEITPAQPSLGVRRSDGQRFVYPGREHAFVGETESAKTWLALACTAAELTAEHHVVYIHYEEGDPASTIERLRLLGVPDDLLAPPLFRFVAPNRAAHKEWIAALLTPPPALVIHDGVNEAMTLHTADIMAADGASTFRRRLIVPFLRAGAATIACDHVPMTRDPSRRDAYGSVHKGNTLDGARIALENVKPFGRDLRGVSKVFVTKDRPGQLRVHGKAQKGCPGKTFIGTLVGDDSDSFTPFSLMFYAPRDGDQPDPDDAGTDPADELREMVWEVITAQPDHRVSSLRMLYAAMRKAGHKFTEKKIRDAVDDLMVNDRLTETTGKNRSKGYEAVTSAAQESSP
jgi:hypothetical protein